MCWQHQSLLGQPTIVKHTDTAVLLTKLKLLKHKLRLHNVSTTAIFKIGCCAQRLF